jgi:nitrogen fixation NifU-like protein
MNSDLRELYQSVILDHNKCPRNFSKPAGANRTAAGVNPLCGDQFTVFLAVEDGVVQDVGFEGVGCAISKASASLMTQCVKGKTIAEAEELFGGFHEMLTGDPGLEIQNSGLGKLEVFAGVREFPMRVKCATLVWHAMHEALRDSGSTATTE